MKDFLINSGLWLFMGFLLMPLIMTSCSADNGIFDGVNNIGNPKLSGRVNYNKTTDIYTLQGAGTNMWNTSDEFFMIWKKVTGDFILSSEIAFEGEGANPHRKMGLIIRESLDANAKYADIAVHGDGLTSLQYRSEKGAETEEVVLSNIFSNNILLERVGSKVIIKIGSGYYPEQSDGEIMLDFPETCYIGLFICSHEANVVETGYFSNVDLKLGY
ncbi:MAG: hypothetical protein LBV72_14455 [Tannerella sp.]|jgi:hypothetical protein|nr:hypothetical protein [Tannerella sp.]